MFLLTFYVDNSIFLILQDSTRFYIFVHFVYCQIYPFDIFLGTNIDVSKKYTLDVSFLTHHLKCILSFKTFFLL